MRKGLSAIYWESWGMVSSCPWTVRAKSRGKTMIFTFLSMGSVGYVLLPVEGKMSHKLPIVVRPVELYNVPVVPGGQWLTIVIAIPALGLPGHLFHYPTITIINPY